MSITVEFFGIARRRTGVERLKIEAQSLGEVLEDLGRRYPGWANECLTGGRLTGAYLANLNGTQFVTDPRTQLHHGDCLLILAADVGG